MSSELYCKFVLAPKSKQPKIVRSFPVGFVCGPKKPFRSFGVSPSLARPASSCVTYLYLTKDSSRNQKARLVG